MGGSGVCIQVGLAVAMMAPMAGGCARDKGGGNESGDMPPEERLVEVPSGGVEVGFAIGVIREPRAVDKFTISRFPVTREEFLACVNSGACTTSETALCVPKDTGSSLDRPSVQNEELPPDAPATCVGLNQAQAYCGWVRGALPTLEQWLLAARGVHVARYAWGAAEPTCEQHPRAIRRSEVSADVGGAERAMQALRQQSSCALADPAPLQVAKHGAGASPLGVNDVLLTRAELLRASAENVFGACALPVNPETKTSGACLVYGLQAGAIDSVQHVPLSAPAEEDDDSAGEVTLLPYGFRCVWAEESST